MASPPRPWFEFHAADFLADESVLGLGLRERGALITLWAFHWKEGSIPADPSMRAKLLGCTLIEEAVIWVHLEKFFFQSPEDQTRLLSKRMMRSLNAAMLIEMRQRQKKDKAAQLAALKGKRMPPEQPSLLPEIPIPDAGVELNQQDRRGTYDASLEAVRPLRKKPAPPYVGKQYGARAKRLREFLEEWPEDVVRSALRIAAFWPTRQGLEAGEGAIRIDRGALIERLVSIIEKAEGKVTLIDLENAAHVYLATKPKWLKHPQHFFGPGRSPEDVPAWVPYAKQVLRAKRQQAERGEAEANTANAEQAEQQDIQEAV